MKKFLILSLFLSSVAFAGIKAKYFSLSSELPKGTTVQITIEGAGVFEVNGSTYTSYTTNYLIPRNSDEIGYDFSVPLSTQVFYLIIHGDCK